MHATLEGLIAGLGLIVAIGAQNAFVLRMGLRRRHPFTVASVSALGDIALITLGAAGLGALIASQPTLLLAARWGGAAFLAWFGYRTLRSALDPAPPAATEGGALPGTVRGAALAALAFSLLNPHAYLDTVVLLGTLAARHDGTDRAAFTAGAYVASVAWFFTLAYGSARLAPWLSTPAAGRAIDLFVTAVMWALAARLMLGA